MINQNKTGKQTFPLSNITVVSGKTRLSREGRAESIAGFDQAKIVEHYRRLRDYQHEKLASINMSEDMKRKLFGFSEGYYLTNEADPHNLIVEDHPLRGKLIQTREKYEQQRQQKQKEKDIRAKTVSLNTLSKVHTERQADFSSDLDENLKNFMDQLPQESINQSSFKLAIKPPSSP